MDKVSLFGPKVSFELQLTLNSCLSYKSQDENSLCKLLGYFVLLF